MQYLILLSAFITIIIAAALPQTNNEQEFNKRALDNFGGVNCYMLPFLTNSQIDSVIKNIKSTGAKVIRTWGFNDVTSTTSNVYFQSFNSSAVTINTGSNGLERLDYVVKAAESAGLKLIIPFVNNWNAYGGMTAYRTYCGGDPKSWYTTTKCQEAYRGYIKAVVSRYANSNGILAWELANRPRCTGCETSVITKWATQSSAYIKSIDPSHLVSIGDEGFGFEGSLDYPYTKSEGLDFVANLAIPTIDFATVHLYPDNWGQSDSSTWGAQWIKDHATAASKAGKPLVLEDFGSKTHANVKAWEAAAVDTAGVTGSLIWQFGDSAIKSYDDGYMIVDGSDEFSTLVTDHMKAMSAKS